MKTSIKCAGALTVALIVVTAFFSLSITKENSTAHSTTSEQYRNSEIKWL